VKLIILVDIYRRFRRTFRFYLKLTLYTIKMAAQYCSEMSIGVYQTTRRLSQKNVNFRCPWSLFPSHSEVKTRRTQRSDTKVNKVCAQILGHNFVQWERQILERESNGFLYTSIFSAGYFMMLSILWL